MTPREKASYARTTWVSSGPRAGEAGVVRSTADSSCTILSWSAKISSMPPSIFTVPTTVADETSTRRAVSRTVPPARCRPPLSTQRTPSSLPTRTASALVPPVGRAQALEGLVDALPREDRETFDARRSAVTVSAMPVPSQSSSPLWVMFEKLRTATDLGKTAARTSPPLPDGSEARGHVLHSSRPVGGGLRQHVASEALDTRHARVLEARAQRRRLVPGARRPAPAPRYAPGTAASPTAARRARRPARRCRPAGRPDPRGPAREPCTPGFPRARPPPDRDDRGSTSSPALPGSAWRFARPKSRTFTRPPPVTMTLEGFRSRWTMPRAWASASASAICETQSMT